MEEIESTGAGGKRDGAEHGGKSSEGEKRFHGVLGVVGFCSVF
jgi:hypothetical protein